MTALTLLGKAAEDLNLGIKLVLPFSMAASAIITVFFPPLGPVIGVVFVAVTLAENHFAGLPKSGPQKLSFVLTIVEPVIKQYCPQGVLVESIVEKVVEILNSYDPSGKPVTAAIGG